MNLASPVKTCSRCGYRYPEARMRSINIYPGSRETWECADADACEQRVVERQRLDSWKRGQRR